MKKNNVKKEPVKDTKKKPLKTTIINEPKKVVKPKKKVTTKDNKKPIKNKPLSHKQIMFCEEYIITQNATQSYLKAYPNVKETTAGTNGSTLLKNTKIKSYIEERLKSTEKKKIADANEILELFTKIARGEVPDQLGLETSVRDRIQAGKELAKRYGLFNEPENPNSKPVTPKIKLTIVDNSNLEEELYK